MRLTRPLLLLVIGTAASIIILRVSLTSISRAQAFVGCPAALGDGQIDPTATVAFWENQPIPALSALTDTLTPADKQVLGSATGSEKWIEIDLSDQKMTAHQGDDVFLSSLVSTGLFGRTPPGEFRIWYKIRATKMEGGVRGTGTYYYLPNVPYTMFFNGEIGIHGTYWHQNFGHPMSHGCVNSPTPVAEKLFYWADPQIPEGKFVVKATADNPGTRVVVHE